MGESVVGRPVSLPSIDMNLMMDMVPEFKAIKDIVSNCVDHSVVVDKLYGTVVFQLATLLQSGKLDLTACLNYPNSDPIVQTFLDEFQSRILSSTSPIDALKKCRKLCADTLNPIFKQIVKVEHVDSTRILLGLSEDDWDNLEFVVPNPIVLDEVSSSFLTLLSLKGKTSVYQSASELLVEILSSSTYDDVYSSTPLEAMFHWVLSVFAEYCGFIDFGYMWVGMVEFECKDFKRKRLFKTDKYSSFDVSTLKKDTYYIADEMSVSLDGGNLVCHPLCAAYFITNKNELIMIDFYHGSNESHIREKMRNLEAFFAKYQVKIPYTLRGIIIASQYNGERILEGEHTLVVMGDEAWGRLLGGLEQTKSWIAR